MKRNSCTLNTIAIHLSLLQARQLVGFLFCFVFGFGFFFFLCVYFSYFFFQEKNPNCHIILVPMILI